MHLIVILIIKHYSSGQGDRTGKSIRIPFPRLGSSTDKNTSLVTKVKEVLESKCDLVRIVRLGLCAVGFQDRAKNSIGGFFNSQPSSKKNDSKPPISQDQCATTNEGESNEGYADVKRKTTSTSHPHNDDRKRPGTEKEHPTSKDKAKSIQERTATIEPTAKPSVEDPDLSYAIKLQAMYDRENNILSSTEQKKNGKGCSKKATQSTEPSKKMRIDSFFIKAKK